MAANKMQKDNTTYLSFTARHLRFRNITVRSLIVNCVVVAQNLVWLVIMRSLLINASKIKLVTLL